MRLVWLETNQRWVFVFGDSLCRLHRPSDDAHMAMAFPLLFKGWSDAVDAAEACGLRVDKDNMVSAR